MSDVIMPLSLNLFLIQKFSPVNHFHKHFGDTEQNTHLDLEDRSTKFLHHYL